MKAPLPSDEPQRLRDLRDYEILDTPPEPEFDDIVELVAEICRTPVALITLVDENRQWFKARRGHAAPETDRESAFCAHAILRPQELLVVPDATRDARFADNPLVLAPGGIRFYAGAPLLTPRGSALGTLCVIDHRPRELDESQRRALATLGRQVVAQMQLRRQNRELRRVESEQRRLAQRLIDAQAVAKVGSWETDLATLEVTWTAETHRIFGTDPASFPPTHARFLHLVHPEDRAAVDAAFRSSQATPEPHVIAHRVCRADGAVRVVEERWRVFHDEAGRPVRAIGTTRDITEARRLEHEASAALAALRASEAELVEAQRVARVGSWTLDLATGNVTWSAELSRMLGLEPGEPVPRLPEQEKYFRPASWRQLNAAVERAIREGVAYELELEMIRRDGSGGWMLARGEPVRGAGGAVERLFGMAQDITARKQLEDRLAEQAALIDQAHDAFVVRGLDRRILFWSRGAERVYGWKAGEATGKDFVELLQPDPAILGEAERVVRKEGEWTGEVPKHHQDGRRLMIQARWTLMRDAAGQPRSILTIDSDVTERRQMEQQLLRAQRMESIGTLAGGIAHDLNNLLAPITMGVELLRRAEPSPASQRVIENIARSAQRGASLVKQVLSFARGVEGERVPLQVRHITREIEAIVENTFPKNISLETQVPADLWLAQGDPTQVHQVLLNLCVNARDAMPAGGRLTLRAENRVVDEQYAVMEGTARPGRYVLLEVGDTGEGMTREVQERIFEPFFTTKELGKGTGLGLSTVLGIVRSHGGFLQVTSERGRGSTFRVFLPALDRSEAEGAAPAPGEQFPRGNGELVLVVDDEVPILTITQQTLESFGYRVLTARDGAQAIGTYAGQSQEVALVLTDMMMPIMDGPALITALRRINPQVRIIAASGLNLESNLSRAGQVGVRHFLAKPYSAELLLQTIQRALQEGVSRSPF